MIEEKLKNVSIDWCVNCALSCVSSKNAKYKMFAWIIVTLLRALPESYRFENNQFVIDLQDLKENDAVSQLLYKKRSWKFLQHFIEIQLDNNNISDIKSADLKIVNDQIIVNLSQVL